MGAWNRGTDDRKIALGNFRPSTADNPRKRRRGSAEAEGNSPSRAPSPPRALAKPAAAIWRSYAREIAAYRRIGPLDRDPLANLCVLTVQLRAAQESGAVPGKLLQRWTMLARHFGLLAAAVPRPAASRFSTESPTGRHSAESARQQRANDGTRARAQEATKAHLAEIFQRLAARGLVDEHGKLKREAPPKPAPTAEELKP